MSEIYQYRLSCAGLPESEKRHPQTIIRELCAAQGVKPIAYRPQSVADQWWFRTDTPLHTLPEPFSQFSQESLANSKDPGLVLEIGEEMGPLPAAPSWVGLCHRDDIPGCPSQCGVNEHYRFHFTGSGRFTIDGVLFEDVVRRIVREELNTVNTSLRSVREMEK